MSIKVQKSPQVEFPASQFPIDIANVALRDASCARERYLAKRFQLTRNVAALLAERAFEDQYTAAAITAFKTMTGDLPPMAALELAIAATKTSLETGS
jgi:hypothetical protein